MHFSILAVCGLLAGALAAPTTLSKRYVVHERRDHLPADWSKNSKVHGACECDYYVAVCVVYMKRPFFTTFLPHVSINRALH